MERSSVIRLLVLLGIGIGVYLFFFDKPDVSGGKLAPDFEASLIDDSAFQLSDLEGSYVLLDFWGSWCPPCRKDNPNLVSLHNEFYNKNFKDADNFHVVTVALEKDLKRWKRAAEKDGFSWKHQIVQKSRFVLSNPIARKYGVEDVPSKFLIGPEGTILASNPTKAEIQEILRAELN